MQTPSWRVLLATIIAALLTGGLIVELADDDGDGRTDRVTVKRPTRAVPAPAGSTPVVVDADNELQADEAAEAKGPAAAGGERGADFHEDTRDETPPDVTPTQLEQGREKTGELADKQLLPPESGGAQAAGCARRPVVNQSGLNGRRVGTALHFTVSDPGSLNAIRGLFDRPSFGASSNYGFELFTLACQQWVPETRKAWAQGAANSAYVSIEIVTRDRSRASWLATPAFKTGRLAALVRDITLRAGAPLKLVDPVGCVFAPGITDHERLECGNSHWDVGRNFPWDVFMRQVRAGVANRATSVDRLTCRKLTWWRQNGRPYGLAERRAIRRRDALASRGVTCTAKGPVRR
jgi:hypothetical protein